MSTTLIATLGGLVALVGWGVSDWLGSRASKRAPATDVNLLVQFVGLAIAAGIFIASRESLPSLIQFSVLGTAALMFTGAYLIFVRALAAGQVGLVTPIGSTFPLYILILSFAFGLSDFSAWQYLSMLIIIFGAVMLAAEKRRKDIPLRTQHKVALMAFTASLGWGVGNFIQNFLIDELAWQTIILTINLVMFITSALIFIYAARNNLWQRVANMISQKYAFFAGAALTSGSVGFYIGGSKVGSLIIPSVISAGQPLVASLLSSVFDKEKLTLIKRAGALVIVAGIILLNLS